MYERSLPRELELYGCFGSNEPAREIDITYAEKTPVVVYDEIHGVCTIPKDNKKTSENNDNISLSDESLPQEVYTAALKGKLHANTIFAAIVLGMYVLYQTCIYIMSIL